MHNKKIFVKTAKAERKGAKLDTDLKRLLSFLDGKTSSGELSRRAPPSLRKNWDELLGDLIKGGYIVDIPAEVNQTRKVDHQELNPLWKGQVEARINTEQSRPIAPAAANAPVTPAAANPLAKPAAVNTQLPPAAVYTDEGGVAKLKAEKAARAAELKAYFATAKEKAKAEAKQAAQEAERARAELEAAAAAARLSAEAENKAKLESRKRAEEAERARAELEAAVAAAKARSENLARAKAEAKQREEDAERARAELEAAIAASRLKPEAKAKLKVEVKQDVATEIPVAKPAHVPHRSRIYKWRGKFAVMDANELARMRKLETENDALKNLLTEAYMEITALKSSLENKP